MLCYVFHCFQIFSVDICFYCWKSTIMFLLCSSFWGFGDMVRTFPQKLFCGVLGFASIVWQPLQLHLQIIRQFFYRLKKIHSSLLLYPTAIQFILGVGDLEPLEIQKYCGTVQNTHFWMRKLKKTIWLSKQSSIKLTFPFKLFFACLMNVLSSLYLALQIYIVRWCRSLHSSEASLFLLWKHMLHVLENAFLAVFSKPLFFVITSSLGVFMLFWIITIIIIVVVVIIII